MRTVFYRLVSQLQAHPVTVTMPAFEPHPVSVRVNGVAFYVDAVGGRLTSRRHRRKADCEARVHSPA